MSVPVWARDLHGETEVIEYSEHLAEVKRLQEDRDRLLEALEAIETVDGASADKILMNIECIAREALASRSPKPSKPEEI